MAGGTWSFRKTVNRKKVFSPSDLEAGNLKRCLNRWDLAGLGVGSTLGIGTYVLLGYVALNLAGPSVVLSFLIAAVGAMLAGLCYAELGTRIPRAGSAYTYTYVMIGEFAAFVVGWNNILEGLFSTASIAKGLSLSLDAATGHELSAWFTSVAPITAGFFSPYFDMLAFCAVLFVGVLLAIGVKESSVVNNALTALNILVICLVVILGAVKADSGHWYISSIDVPDSYGSGGFFPYGIWGTLKGAAVCFYGFVGFDTITAAGEETKNPRENVPIAILMTLVLVFFAYTSVAIVVTMVIPYYLQDSLLSVAGAFSRVGWDWAWWIVSIGTICGISTSLYGAFFPLPRLLYAMASDGLFLKFFDKITLRKSPVIATLIPAAIIAVLSSVMELEQLLMMLCIGTLLSYTSVAACVMLLRYRSDDTPIKPGCSSMFGCGMNAPSRTTTRIIVITLLLFICTCVTSALVLLYANNSLIPVLVLHAVALVLLFVMCCQPKVFDDFTPKTPLVPLIPCLSIYVNIHLMTLINLQTWIRVLVWIAIGIPVYIICCCYKTNGNNLEGNIKSFAHVDKNGKTPVQIVVESPTPPNSKKMINDFGAIIDNSEEMIEIQPADIEEISRDIVVMPVKKEDILVHHAIIENSEEKEAKIIDLLDQVLQAEEDRYGEIINLKEEQEEEDVCSTAHETVVHRKSLSELSDAGSDASIGNQVLSKYDVIAQVHREDLPIVSEEEERIDKGSDDVENIELEEFAQATDINESETNSRTDESGYSDTMLDRTGLNGSTENFKDDVPYIPPPPPFDEEYFSKSVAEKSNSIPKVKNIIFPTPSISQDGGKLPPPPPPLDEEYFSRPGYHKFNSIPKVKSKLSPASSILQDEEQLPPRESINSNTSQPDGNMVFGSDRQIHFMSKLSGIFANKLNTEDEQEQRRRSHSTGNVVEGTELATISRPTLLLDLNKEFLEKKGKDLRPVKVENDKSVEPEEVPIEEAGDGDGDLSMTRNDLKSKLESIFASGGTMLVKPRLMKSNPPTPEENNQIEASLDNLPKISKEEKNDTLSRQKVKFGKVLNSFRQSYNSDDQV